MPKLKIYFSFFDIALTNDRAEQALSTGMLFASGK
jgi:hypothetical protein